MKLEGLCKFYGRIRAVDKVSLRIGRGVFGLVGPNGAGKTTLLSLLAGLRRPDRGRGWVLGFPIGVDGVEVRRRTGFLWERHGFLPEFPLLTQLAFAARCKGYGRREARREAMRLLRLVGLEGKASAPVKTLSAGMKQRLAIAQALIGDPSLLVLDEPTSNLDPVWRERLFQILRERVEEGASIIASSHLLYELEGICTSYGLMNGGRILRVLTSQELHSLAELAKIFQVTATRTEALTPLLSQAPWVKEFREEKGSLVVEVENPKLLWRELPLLADQAGSTLLSVTPLQDPLLQLLKDLTA